MTPLTKEELEMSLEDWAQAIAEDPSCIRTYLLAAIEQGRLERAAEVTNADARCEDLAARGLVMDKEMCSLRAALQERDAAWRKALDDSHYGSGHRWRPAEWELCPACAPLRALLEEAGK